MPEIMTIEEIETGIHPSRLRLLVELFRSQTNRGKTQVFATTHSPTALAWLQEAEYRTTFLCKRDEETGESTIRPLVDVPSFQGGIGEVCYLGPVRRGVAGSRADLFQPLLDRHGDRRRPGGGRDLMIGESLRNLSLLYRLCPELRVLHGRIAALLRNQ